MSWPDIHIGQVIKRYQGKRVIDIIRRMARGCFESAQALLQKSRGGTKLNTALIERLNATFRSHLAVLVRRSRALIRIPQTLEPLMYLMEASTTFAPNTKVCACPGSPAAISGSLVRLLSLRALPIIFGL